MAARAFLGLSLTGWGLVFTVLAVGYEAVVAYIQVFIWVFTDDDLQYWCERCAFGQERNRSWTPTRQQEEFFKAMQAVGMSA